jgi:hypothetical protein
MNAATNLSKENSLKDLQTIPGVGKSILRIYSISELKSF